MSKVANSFISRGCLNPVTSAGRTSVDIGAAMVRACAAKKMMTIGRRNAWSMK